MKKTKLSEAEKNLAFEVAKKRENDSKSLCIINNKKSTKRSSIWINYNGAAGEIAFTKIMLENNIISKEEYKACLSKIVNDKLKPASIGLDDGDIRIKNFNIDIKTSEYANAHLWLTKNKKSANKIDYYALLIGNIDNSNEFELKGFMSHQYAISNWNKTISGVGGKFRQSELTNLFF